MRNIILFLFAVSLMACGASKMLDLKLNLKEGSEMTYKMTQNSDMGMNVMGMDTKITGQQATTYKYEVKEVLPDGTTRIDMTIAEMVMNQNMPMMSSSFDSKNSSKATPPEMGKMLGTMIGKTMKLEMNKQGEITSIEGSDKIFDEMADEVSEEMAPMMEGMKAQFGEAAFTSAFGQIAGFYPEKPVKIGDSWIKKDTVASQMPMLMTNTYTLRERKAGKSTIDVKGTIVSLALDEESKGVDMMGMDVEYEMTGTTEGVVEVDDATGWTIRSTMLQKSGGNMKMSGGPMGDMDMKMDMKMEYIFEKL